MTAPSLPSRAQWSRPTFSKLLPSSGMHQPAGGSDRPQALFFFVKFDIFLIKPLVVFLLRYDIWKPSEWTGKEVIPDDS